MVHVSPRTAWSHHRGYDGERIRYLPRLPRIRPNSPALHNHIHGLLRRPSRFQGRSELVNYGIVVEFQREQAWQSRNTVEAGDEGSGVSRPPHSIRENSLRGSRMKAKSLRVQIRDVIDEAPGRTCDEPNTDRALASLATGLSYVLLGLGPHAASGPSYGTSHTMQGWNS